MMGQSGAKSVAAAVGAKVASAARSLYFKMFMETGQDTGASNICYPPSESALLYACRSFDEQCSQSEYLCILQENEYSYSSE